LKKENEKKNEKNEKRKEKSHPACLWRHRGLKVP
jgi:hypothetical protein